MTDGSRVDGLGLICYGTSPDRVPVKAERTFVDIGNALEESKERQQHLDRRGYTHIDCCVVTFVFLFPFFYCGHVFYAL
jgi:hypothetical protein